MWLKYLTYISLLISVLSIWVPAKTLFKPWQLFLGISLVLSFFSDIANPIAILAIILFYCLVLSYRKSASTWQWGLWGLVLALGLALELHIIPGFNNLLVLNKIQFSQDAIPFSMYLNLDKTAVGIIILGLTLNLAGKGSEWKTLLQQVFYRLPVILVIMLVLSMVFGYVKFEPKLPQHLWIWIINYLFFASMAEEALFRGFFQERLSQLNYRYSEYIAVLIPALVFGIIHYPGGFTFVILATVAGILYGWIYKVTKRIEASIIAHFMLNLIHLIFFTYPALIP